MDGISSIARLLAYCGISSVRMFAPTFLFGLICRFMPTFSWCPDGISKMAESCPHFLSSNFGLVIFGVLGVLEVVANWEDSIKELLSETNIETYVKPLFAAITTFSICTPEQAQVLSAAVNGVPDAVAMASDPSTASATGGTFTAIVSAAVCGGGTFGLCKVRSYIVSTIRELDPDNTLHLNTFLTLFEEGSWLAILPIVLIFPILALLLMVIIAVLGWALSIPLKKLAAKRRAHWDAVGMEGMLKAVRNRAIVIFIAGVFLSTIPVFGYLATVISLNFLVFGVIALYEKPAYRILVKLVMRFIKLTLFLFSLLFSGIPFMGILLLLPYVASYFMRIHRLKKSCAANPPPR